MGRSVLAIDMPPVRDFLLSPGFASVLALLAAIVVAAVVLLRSREAERRSETDREQSERQHDERRADEQRAAAMARCWDRWWQVVEAASLEPSASEGATLGLGPEVALELLRGLLRDAEELRDDTLAKAIAVYQEQLLLVLAQQSGPLADLAKAPTASSNGGPPAKPVRKTSRAAREEAAETPSAADEEITAGGQR